MLGNNDKFFLNSFVIRDHGSCKKAIKNGGIATMISAAITGFYCFASFIGTSCNNGKFFFVDPWMLLEFVIFVVLGFGVFKKSRIASTLLLFYFLWAKLSVWFKIGSLKWLLITIVLFIYMVIATIGTYIWHSKYCNMTKINA